MGGMVRDDGGPRRDYPALYARLCTCGGLQPSRTDPKLDLHERWCPYRAEVEGEQPFRRPPSRRDIVGGG